MTQTYFMKLTDAGAAAIAAEQAGGAAVTLSEMAVGDGNGNPVAAPTGAETTLLREVFRAAMSSLTVDPSDGTIVRAEVIIPPESGGFAVREVGVFTADGTLFAYGNFPDTYKPTAAEGSTRDMVVVAAIKVGTADSVDLVIDASIVGATRQWVLNTITAGLLLPGGTTGQVLRKASNADGDTEWFDPSEGLNVIVASISETATAAAGQRTFNLSTTVTSGLAVYVEGVRLRNDEWVALNATQVQLEVGLPAGTKVEFINNEEVGNLTLASVSLVGPSLVFPGSSNTYTITDFDAFSTYVVTSDIGTVSRTNETITLDIGAAEPAGNLNLIVTRNGDGNTYQIAIGAQSVAQPEILNPASGAIDVGSGVTVTTSAFLTYPNGADTHASTDWQIATDTGFTAIVFQSLADATNLEAIDVPTGTFNTSTVYYIRARHNGTTLGASQYSATVSFTTDDFFEPSIGEAFGGGFYAGNIIEGGVEYRIIVAPKASGESASLQFKTSRTASPAATITLNDGAAATAAMVAAGSHPAAAFCAGLTIGGFSDWYLPARDELELLYRNLKPGTDDNSALNRAFSTDFTYPEGGDLPEDIMGVNRNSSPSRTGYRAGAPRQTSVTAFITGGTEAFASTFGASSDYWSSTVFTDLRAWTQRFQNGEQNNDNKDAVLAYVRAVRRFPV